MEGAALVFAAGRIKLKNSCMNMYNCTRQNMGTRSHYPRLDTVIMVEDRIKRARSYLTRAQLWKSLPKKVQYQTFCTILGYLADSRKIIFTRDRRIVWVFADSDKARALLSGSVRAHA